MKEQEDSLMHNVDFTDEEALPVSVRVMGKVKKSPFPKTAPSSFYRTEKYFCIPFIKPMSKLINYD